VSTASATTAITTTNAWQEWNVTADVSLWYGGTSNYGWLLASTDTDGDYVEFRSSEYGSGLAPQLVITTKPQ